MTLTMPTFKTIKETSKLTGISEYKLRKMEKEKKLPCIYSGKRCLINLEMFAEMLNKMDENLYKNANANETNMRQT